MLGPNFNLVPIEGEEKMIKPRALRSLSGCTLFLCVQLLSSVVLCSCPSATPSALSLRQFRHWTARAPPPNGRATPPRTQGRANLTPRHLQSPVGGYEV